MPEFFQWLMEHELPFGLYWHPDADPPCDNQQPLFGAPHAR